AQGSSFLPGPRGAEAHVSSDSDPGLECRFHLSRRSLYVGRRRRCPAPLPGALRRGSRRGRGGVCPLGGAVGRGAAAGAGSAPRERRAGAELLSGPPALGERVTFLHWYWRPVNLPVIAPELPEVLLEVGVCLFLFDFEYFLWHLLHHKVPWLYKTFHKVHHKHVSTFALTTQYSSVWELLSLGFFAAINPVLLGCHPLTEMIFFLVNIWLSVEDHSGYDLPWSTHRLVPFGLYGGAPHHDLHHLKFKSNYAPYFTHWDKLFGTFTESHSN
uniref:Cholesterol 25-hydroxylase n=1 Tax=Otus sunia TaxID=257818 RepID=A0A8C8AFK8_9STRI